MSEPIQGGCHCGAIRYRVNGELLGVINCHCSDCRRWHGNYASYAVAKLSDFEFTKGEDALRWYDSSNKARRGFCAQCGATLKINARFCHVCGTPCRANSE